VALVCTDVSEEHIASIITANVVHSSLILSNLMMVANMFLQNVGSNKSHMASYSRRWHFSGSMNTLQMSSTLLLLNCIHISIKKIVIAK
jgi:hypothetical protein